MAKALFVTANEVKRRSNIKGNVDDDKIVQFIEKSQELHVQNYMGTNLYEKVQGLLEADTIDDAGNSAYKTLWTEYIKPMACWFAIGDYLPWAMFEIDNSGINKKFSQSSDPITLEELDRLNNEADNAAQFYTQRFIDYVCANLDSFPEYSTTSNNSDMHPDGDVSYGGGWVL